MKSRPDYPFAVITFVIILSTLFVGVAYAADYLGWQYQNGQNGNNLM
jgi:hypothetical protein